MKYTSTRGFSPEVNAAQAMLNGLAPDGGLYICDLDAIQTLNLPVLIGKSYQEVAEHVLAPFFPEIKQTDLRACIDNAYNSDVFDHQYIVPVVSVGKRTYIAELFWGRTLAFKDVALSLFPYLLLEAKKSEHETRQIAILTATSGDTGKAAMEGFRDVEGIDITVFYPEDGVSAFQKRQMQTQQGQNIQIYGINGNFDDAQSALKAVFQDSAVQQLAAEANTMLASANSINIGRLFPQVVYYVTSYLKMVEQGEVEFGDAINIVVPTGNFGNIFSGYIASRLGVPVNRFISASNENDVLADFFETGVYDIQNRPFHVTSSPSMDILLSSNFERYLYAVLNQDTKKTKAYMDILKKTGRIELTANEHAEVKSRFYGGRATNADVEATIADVYQKENYVLDPHTAVAYFVGKQYMLQTDDQTPQLIMATAHPYKFSQTVAKALKLKTNGDTEDEIKRLSAHTGVFIPKSVSDVFTMPIRFQATLDKKDIHAQIQKNISGE